MKPLSKMSKKELKKIPKEKQKQLLIQELKEILSNDTFFDGAIVDVNFKDKNLKVFSGQ